MVLPIANLWKTSPLYLLVVIVSRRSARHQRSRNLGQERLFYSIEGSKKMSVRREAKSQIKRAIMKDWGEVLDREWRDMGGTDGKAWSKIGGPGRKIR